MLCLSAGGNHLLGAKDPGYLYATLQQPPALVRDSNLKGNKMNEYNQVQVEGRVQYVVGMDAHSKKLAISIWECSNLWKPMLYKEIRCCAITDMEATYKHNVPKDSITIIESSTNSATLKKRLENIGFRAGIVRSDIISDKERKRKVRDIQDARNLAQAYIKGNVQEFVWVPSDQYADYRDIYFAHRDTVKEITRSSNRIWSICSRKGYDLPIRSGAAKGESIRKMVEQLQISGFIKERLEMLVADYEFFLERKVKLEKLMAEAIIENDKMLALMQLPGFYYHAAFVIATIVEDAKRFSSAAKLTAYAGLSPMINTSGEEEQKAMLKGGPGKPLDGDGRMDLKFYCCEAGQTVLNLCSKSDIGKWGWRMINRGKPKNKVCCAIGRKLITYVWHILRGDPSPNREGEGIFKRKMLRFYSVLGRQRMFELGYPTRADFSNAMSARFYGHLPESIKAKE